MKKKALNLLRLLRPRQWIKNFFVFGAILFAGELFNLERLQVAVWSFVVFCGLSSAIYVINDIFDREKDRQHPFKKFRPIASREISVSEALVTSLVLLFFSMWLGLYVGHGFFLLAIIYVLMQICYSIFLKHIAVIDILVLAAGYILRVYAGELASSYHISVWLLLTTISISLFLAIGKRRSELTLVSHQPTNVIAATRKSLSHYSERLLDVYASIFATSTFISYALFTFLENPSGFKLGIGILLPDFLPEFFHRKWLMITILPVVYGLMRYLQDIYEKHEGESPEKVLLGDKPLLITVGMWVLLVIVILYLLPA